MQRKKTQRKKKKKRKQKEQQPKVLVAIILGNQSQAPSPSVSPTTLLNVQYPEPCRIEGVIIADASGRVLYQHNRRGSGAATETADGNCMGGVT